jgi:peptide/nickel transport system substrate-binding protein
VDDYTVRVKLSEPYAPFLAVLTDRAGIMASPKAIKESGDFRVSLVPGLGYGGFYLNTREPPFDDELLRQAVYRLVNRDAIVKAVLRGVGGTPANSPFSEQSFAYGESDDYPERSVDEAKKLLEQAGKPDGFSFTYKTDPSPTSQQLG